MPRINLSPPPHLESNGRVWLATIAVALAASIALIGHSDSLVKSLGDPDDAMRLVLVRDLLAGRSWYDQLVGTLQPPHGVFLHWSRLLDGALAGVILIFRFFLSPENAEAAARLLWPLFWTVPAIFCALTISRRLDGSLSVFACAILLASNQQAFAQFIPGRIDHHNVQLVLTLIAAACAMASENRSLWAAVAGIASGLGLAIGIEALPFHVLIGLSYAIRAVLERDTKDTTRTYGISLLGASLLFYCAQTPPWRWSLSFCDAIGLNLIAAIAVASGGLFLITWNRCGRSVKTRLLCLTATAPLTMASYLVFDPRCLGGPLAAVDPRIRPFWLDRVDEMQPLSVIIHRFQDLGISSAWLSASILASIGLVFLKPRPQDMSAWLLSIMLAALAVIGGLQAFRMQSYAFWLGFPILATALSYLANRYLSGLMVPTVILCVALSPVTVGALVRAESSSLGRFDQSALQTTRSACHDTQEYTQLRRLPAGLVLADISMGPFILANTPDSVLNAPYHRMTWGILASHEALTADSGAAEAKFHELKVDYLVECPANASAVAPHSIEWDLQHGVVPRWLQPLSRGDQVLQVYRVREN